jgi:hypothetical protein
VAVVIVGEPIARIRAELGGVGVLRRLLFSGVQLLVDFIGNSNRDFYGPRRGVGASFHCVETYRGEQRCCRQQNFLSGESRSTRPVC